MRACDNMCVRASTQSTSCHEGIVSPTFRTNAPAPQRARTQGHGRNHNVLPHQLYRFAHPTQDARGRRRNHSAYVPLVSQMLVGERSRRHAAIVTMSPTSASVCEPKGCNMSCDPLVAKTQASCGPDGVTCIKVEVRRHASIFCSPALGRTVLLRHDLIFHRVGIHGACTEERGEKRRSVATGMSVSCSWCRIGHEPSWRWSCTPAGTTCSTTTLPPQPTDGLHTGFTRRMHQIEDPSNT